jgi:hypothetical protein
MSVAIFVGQVIRDSNPRCRARLMLRSGAMFVILFANAAPFRTKWRTRVPLKMLYNIISNQIRSSYSSALIISTPLARDGVRMRIPEALVTAGASVHFLQELAHRIELSPEAFPISGLQSLHCLIVAIKRLPGLICRRACQWHPLRRA